MRGNKYSRRHVKYTPKDPEFWEFTFDEMAKYDVPAMLMEAISQSNSTDQKISYVGHSQGELTNYFTSYCRLILSRVFAFYFATSSS